MFEGNSYKTWLALLSTLIAGSGCQQMPMPSIDRTALSDVAVVRYLPDFSAFIKEAEPTVVYINATKRLNAFNISRSSPDYSGGESIYELLKNLRIQGQPYYDILSQSTGSGFIIDHTGYILTNSHVVEDAEHIVVKLADKREFEATLVGVDKLSDVGLLKISARNLPVVRIGDPDKLDIGEWVFAIGAPFGFTSSVTQGIISATRRELPRQNVAALIQTDVSINPGNSGGPLFNLSGEVIGINTEIYSASGTSMGVSFAIPIDEAIKVTDKLRSAGLVKRSRLGVSIQTASWDIGEPFGRDRAGGAIISSLEKGGPADNAGLRTGDIILEFDNQDVMTSGELLRFVSNSPPGHKAKIKVWREKSTLDVDVGLMELEDYAAIARSKINNSGFHKSGLDLRELSILERKRLYTEGIVYVETVIGKALLSGLESGDIILAINNRPVSSIKDLRSQLTKSRDRIVLLVQRDASTKLFIPLLKPDVEASSAFIENP